MSGHFLVQAKAKPLADEAKASCGQAIVLWTHHMWIETPKIYCITWGPCVHYLLVVLSFDAQHLQCFVQELEVMGHLAHHIKQYRLLLSIWN